MGSSNGGRGGSGALPAIAAVLGVVALYLAISPGVSATVVHSVRPDVEGGVAATLLIAPVALAGVVVAVLARRRNASPEWLSNAAGAVSTAAFAFGLMWSVVVLA